ncbi:MAG: pantoate--beta-alanine ligase [bacterium]|nr:pantoate--beta-alanine ligase [bacterium]
MEIIKGISEMHKKAKEFRLNGMKIGFVPTMGALHEGHLSLMRRARLDNDIVVISIYVNPIQFGPLEDYKTYPRDLESDAKKAQDVGVDIIFAPMDKEMYQDKFSTFVEVENLTSVLEGRSRPSHFKGVTTVVCKLFNIVKPDVTYFGQKDYQQALVIKRMIRDLNFDIELQVLPIIRDKDGLALSSRNNYLSEKERRSATILFECLQKARELLENGERDSSKILHEMRSMIEKRELVNIDYVEIVDSENLERIPWVKGELLVALAVRIGKTRLIDNMLWSENK